ncbi:Holliday junction branch migration protein RuvA [Thermaurantiacus sp.]
MIASLSGTVQALGASEAVIDVQGVGYLVQASQRTLDRLRGTGSAPVFLLVETQVREESITLFGFATEAERALFRLLSSVQGVGGRLALALLSTFAPDELARAISLDDRALIARAPGVGPRLAARIATELKGKALPGAGAALAAVVAPAPATPQADAIAALEALGFRGPEALRAVAEAEAAAGAALTTAELVREALKRAKG